jgi:hypothetical protein
VTVLVVLLVVVVLAAAGAAAVARTGQKRFTAANEVVPGTASAAPAGWAGAHSPEAVLHRRLRDAVAALRANPAMEDAWAMDARVSLEQQALAVDGRLVAVAALPQAAKAARMPAVAAAVDAVESAVASLADPPSDARRPGIDQAMADVDRRLAALAEAPAPSEEGGAPPVARPGTG